jgi:hypothetical protein
MPDNTEFPPACNPGKPRGHLCLARRHTAKPFQCNFKAQNLPYGWVGAVLDSACMMVGQNYFADNFVDNKAGTNLQKPLKNHRMARCKSAAPAPRRAFRY